MCVPRCEVQLRSQVRYGAQLRNERVVGLLLFSVCYLFGGTSTASSRAFSAPHSIWDRICPGNSIALSDGFRFGSEWTLAHETKQIPVQIPETRMSTIENNR